MLVSMLLDDADESVVTALFQVQDKVIQIKQRPHEGRVCDKELEEVQEKVSSLHLIQQATSRALTAQATTPRPVLCPLPHLRTHQQQRCTQPSGIYCQLHMLQVYAHVAVT
jgi:hypothetical protein